MSSSLTQVSPASNNLLHFPECNQMPSLHAKC